MDLDIQLAAEGLAFPEGPVAMADGSVILTEIRGGRLTRVWPDGRMETVAETGGGPNGLAVGPDGALYVCNNGGRFSWIDVPGGVMYPGDAPPEHKGGSIQRVDLASGAVTTVYDNFEGQPLWAPNDLVFDRAGGFWFTDHSRSDHRTLNYGGLYYARPDGSALRQVRNHMISLNGVGLAPDESVVYAADTQLGRLWAFDLTGPGQIGSYPPGHPGRVVANLPGYQLLDSLAVEAGGKVCVATIMNGGITAFDPDGTTEHFAFPDLLTTNICFGGPDMRDAWVTCSSTGKLYRCRWPRPGLKLNFNA
jgi:gluconolactonase